VKQKIKKLTGNLIVWLECKDLVILESTALKVRKRNKKEEEERGGKKETSS
jgi:hypothetical protein